jgi:hypothetical protein
MKFQVQVTDEAGNVQHYVLTSNCVPQSKSLDDFILDALQISDDKRKLPLKIQCPNGLEVYPSIKMRLKDFCSSLFGSKVESMHITW